MFDQNWQQELTSLGFNKQTAKSYEKEVNAIKQRVSSRKDPRRVAPGFVVDIDLLVEDKYKVPPEWVVMLVYRLAETDVHEIQDGGHSWWPEEHAHDALQAFKNHAVPFLHRYSQVQTIIEQLEAGVQHGVPIPDTQTASVGSIRTLVAKVFGGNSKTSKHSRRWPPVYHYFLSLLYELEADREAACLHLQKHKEHLSKIQLADEPERTNRQFTGLSCDSII